VETPSPFLKLVAHHVGARGFGVSLNVPAAFRQDVVHVLYEADAECVERMLRDAASAHSRLLAERYVLPYCLGRRRGTSTFNIMANSYASSVFPPDPRMFGYYCEIAIDAAVYDVAYREMLEVVRRVDVEVHSLDELFAEGKIPLAAQPDVLSIDTQGSELDILEGARRVIDEGVLGIVCEVEMIPMYAGQPLLGDILNFATRHGFIFAGFTNLHELSPARAPIGFRGKAFPGFGDALFLRDLDTLTEGTFAPESLYVMTRKLAFISLCFGYVEYALAAIRAGRRLEDRVSPALRSKLQALDYAKVLDQVESVAEEAGGLFPPLYAMPDDARAREDGRTSWYDKYHQKAMGHFNAVAAASGAPPPGASTGHADGLPRRVARALRRLPGGDRVLSSRVATALRRALALGVTRRAAPVPPTSAPHETPGHPWLGIPHQTTFEALLEAWGFSGPAAVVRQRRLAAERYVRTLDAELYDAGAHVHLPRS
jgi:FkbM family methyltransferase